MFNIPKGIIMFELIFGMKRPPYFRTIRRPQYHKGVKIPNWSVVQYKYLTLNVSKTRGVLTDVRNRKIKPCL